MARCTREVWDEYRRGSGAAATWLRSEHGVSNRRAADKRRPLAAGHAARRGRPRRSPYAGRNAAEQSQWRRPRARAHGGGAGALK